jgi:hypothetical protein
MTFGTFISPDHSLASETDLATRLKVQVHSGYRAIDEADAFLGQNRIFDDIAMRAQALDFAYEDQCSAKYYLDLVRTLRDFNGEYDRVVEVGVYMGGASGVLAGCAERFDFDLDMIDIHANRLHFAYERIRRMYPEAVGRVRLFHGDLPHYVQAIRHEQPVSTIVHHDGSHDFNVVVKDLAALSFIRERLCAIIAQDTHLRGRIEHMNFVDMALYAVFGLDMAYAPIGTAYAADDERVHPNPYQGNYFMADAPEGFVLPMHLNEFRYPHPRLTIDDFLPQPLALAA